MSSSSAVSQAHLDTLSTAKTQLLAAVAEKFQNVERALSAIDADRTERHQQMKKNLTYSQILAIPNKQGKVELTKTRKEIILPKKKNRC